jgi:hypothetical protein
MLPDRAILVLVNDQLRVARGENVIDVSGLQQSRCGDTYIRVIGRGIGQIEKRLIMRCSFGKRGDEPHRPSVDRQQAIGLRTHAGAVKPFAQRGDPGIGVGQDQNGFCTFVPGEALGNEMGFAAPGRCGHGTASDR